MVKSSTNYADGFGQYPYRGATSTKTIQGKKTRSKPNLTAGIE